MDIFEFVDRLTSNKSTCDEKSAKKLRVGDIQFSCEKGCDTGTKDDDDSENCDGDGCY